MKCIFKFMREFENALHIKKLLLKGYDESPI
jgi:hypothetical protein